MEKRNSILRWGIIGCGSVAETKGGPALYSVPGSELVAVTSRNAGKARRFAQRHGAKRYHDKAEALLNDEEINAVYIATPVSSHYSFAIDAAQAGKHILCEKPMGMNVEECRLMIEASRKNKVTLMIAYYRRFFPNITKARELIEKEAIGKPVFAKVMTSSPFNPGKNHLRSWRTNPQIGGGGVLMDIGSHRLDLLLYLFGDAARIEGFSSRSSLGFPVEDSVTFAMQFKTNVQAMGFFTWALPAKYDTIEIFGTEGKITIDSINSGRLQLQNQDGITELQRRVLEYTHLGLVRDFVRHIETGSPISCPGEVGLKTNRLIAQIYGQRQYLSQSQ